MHRLEDRESYVQYIKIVHSRVGIGFFGKLGRKHSTRKWTLKEEEVEEAETDWLTKKSRRKRARGESQSS